MLCDAFLFIYHPSRILYEIIVFATISPLKPVVICATCVAGLTRACLVVANKTKRKLAGLIFINLRKTLRLCVVEQGTPVAMCEGISPGVHVSDFKQRETT